LRGGGRQVHPEFRTVRFHHLQFAGLRFTGLKELFAAVIEYVLVLFENEPGDRLLGQCPPGDTQHGGNDEVGFEDQPLLA
jgi:hypothetical protein